MQTPFSSTRFLDGDVTDYANDGENAGGLVKDAVEQVMSFYLQQSAWSCVRPGQLYNQDN